MNFLILLLSSIGIILWWRGVWELANKYLLPKNHKASLWVGLLFGIILITIAYLLARNFSPELLGVQL